MTTLLSTLLPMILGSVLAPTQVTIVILFLQSPQRGLLKGIAYAAGGVTVRLLQGYLFALLLSGGDLTFEHHDWHSAVAYTLLIVLGIALLITAYEERRRGEGSTETQPKWLEKIDGMSVFAAFGVGFVEILVALNLWVFTLGALAVIAAADLGPEMSTAAFLLFVLLVELPVLVPILVRLLLPKRSTSVLQSISDWIERHDHIIITVVAIGLGLLLLARGIVGLVTYD